MYDSVRTFEVLFVCFGVEDVGAAPGDVLRP